MRAIKFNYHEAISIVSENLNKYIELFKSHPVLSKYELTHTYINYCKSTYSDMHIDELELKLHTKKDFTLTFYFDVSSSNPEKIIISIGCCEPLIKIVENINIKTFDFIKFNANFKDTINKHIDSLLEKYGSKYNAVSNN
ncbi:MAG TPA: hypothetical protein VN698_09270 [Bacteroidia bacterium]|nr:hypothetical protein [Bacteroidia bacterium]